jgi:hypothetical protein
MYVWKLIMLKYNSSNVSKLLTMVIPSLLGKPLDLAYCFDRHAGYLDPCAEEGTCAENLGDTAHRT